MDYRTKYEEATGVKIPHGFHVHHIDVDRENNEILNLVAIPNKLHNQIHFRENGFEDCDEELNKWIRYRDLLIEAKRSAEVCYYFHTNVSVNVDEERLFNELSQGIIIHDLRKRFGLQTMDYFLVDTAYQISVRDKDSSYARVTRTFYSNLLGFSERHVSRIYKRLKKKGLIEKGPYGYFKVTSLWSEAYEEEAKKVGLL